MLKPRLLRRLTVLFAVLALCIWSASVLLTLRRGCSALGGAGYPLVSLWSSLQAHGSRRGADTKLNSSGVSQWFWKQLPKHAEEGKALVQSACPATDHSVQHSATLRAIGDIHLTLSDSGVLETSAVSSLRNLSALGGGTDAVVTNLASLIPDEKKETVNAVRVLRQFGVQLVSLANEHVLQRKDSAKLMPTTVHVLEAAGIRWLGLNAKHHEIVSIQSSQNVRVGVLAFCGVHGDCMESSNLPYSPIKYSNKASYTAFSEMKAHSVDVIVVLMHWGSTNSLFPDETALVIARQLSERGADLVIGHHPTVIQDHAYFGNTLILFSLGKMLSSEAVSSYCWLRDAAGGAGGWSYSTTELCLQVHPNNRDRLFHSEQHTRVYRIHFSRLHPPIADYVTVPLETESSYPHIRRPSHSITESQPEWTRVCGDRDMHCLACETL